MSDFLPLQKLIPKAISRYKMTRETRAAHICQRFRVISPEIIGEDSAQNIKPKFFKGGVLYISVPSSVWAQRVYVHRHDLIMKLNFKMEKEWVRDIRMHVEG